MEIHEHVRLIYKHLKWAADHVAEIHNQIKPAEVNEITPQNQMTMFGEDIDDVLAIGTLVNKLSKKNKDNV